MSIDWSRAPEGATHYGPAVEGQWLACWHKKVDGQWLGWLADGDTRWGPSGNTVERMKQLISRPQDWTGEGLPPVGTVCEYDARAFGKGDPLWVTVEINYLSKWNIVFVCIAVPDGTRQENVGVELSADVGVTINRFRLIRTPEQIASEERQKNIMIISDILIANRGNSNEYHQAGLIYDAGYRKQVKP